MSSLQELDLSGNTMIGSDGGGAAIAAALRINTTLHTLGLADTGIDAAGAVAIVKALTVNPSLRRLDLSSNAIGVDGVTAIAEALGSNQGMLQELDLSDNDSGNVGVIAIARAMETNTSLQMIGLDGLVPGDDATTTATAVAAVATIEAALARNRNNLQELRESYTAVRSFAPPFDVLIDRGASP
jgi:NLR family CARD domain-containing protein 3